MDEEKGKFENMVVNLSNAVISGENLATNHFFILNITTLHR